jgi:hypothetical protein
LTPFSFSESQGRETAKTCAADLLLADVLQTPDQVRGTLRRLMGRFGYFGLPQVLLAVAMLLLVLYGIRSSRRR